MTKTLSKLAITAAALISALCSTERVIAQVAGATTTVATEVTESTTIAMGWSVKNTLLGKAIYNDAGQKIGKIEDLIISPNRDVSFLIVGAGGFVGIGRHDVAIRVTQIQDRAGKLVLLGATKGAIKAMPEFAYVSDTTERDAFVTAADKDVTRGKAELSDLEKKASVATADAKARLDSQIKPLRADLKSAESELAEMKQATGKRWKRFEAGVSTTTARIRKSLDTAAG